jgi:uncharacterized protein (DUF58 family)
MTAILTFVAGLAVGGALATFALALFTVGSRADEAPVKGADFNRDAEARRRFLERDALRNAPRARGDDSSPHSGQGVEPAKRKETALSSREHVVVTGVQPNRMACQLD